MRNIPIENFKVGDLKYEFNDKGYYTHNYNRDFQFIILWENGRKNEKDVLSIIENEFEIKYCVEVNWSKEYRRSNFNRLYSQQLNSKSNLRKHKRVGMGNFLCIVFEDHNPNYQYLKSLSGDIFIGNKNAVDVKYDIRKLLGDNLLHGTANISEFFHHGSLIFHEKLLNQIISISSWDRKTNYLKQDIAGAAGWKDFEEFFKTVNYSSDWAVLRNHEFLPDNFWGNDKDIDLICDNLKKFASAANARKRNGGLSAYETMIEGKTVLLDIRYVGDNYYDSVWEIEMLRNKNYKAEYVPILRDDDYFFSLLYHAQLQKREVKDIYVPRLLKLGERIGLNDLTSESIISNIDSARILNGFLNEKGYYFNQPHDNRVYLNKSTYKYITAHPRLNKEPIKSRSIKFISRVVPSPIKNMVPKKMKNQITKRIN